MLTQGATADTLLLYNGIKIDRKDEKGREALAQYILKHLNLWQERIPKGLPPPEDPIVETIVCEEFDDGWGSYSDPDVSMH